MNGGEIIDRMAEKYRSCKSYQDTGRVEDDGNSLPFRTSFVRRDLFRFDWTDSRGRSEAERCFVGSDGIDAFIYCGHGRPIEKCEGLSRAIAGATGISQGAAHQVSVLLMPDIIGGRNLSKHEATYDLLEDEVVVEVWCHHVRCNIKPDHWQDYWIDKNDFSLRKIKDDCMTGGEAYVKELEPALQRLPDFYEMEPAEQANLLEGLKAPMRLITETVYETVIFDQEISKDIFQFSLPS